MSVCEWPRRRSSICLFGLENVAVIFVSAWRWESVIEQEQLARWVVRSDDRFCGGDGGAQPGALDAGHAICQCRNRTVRGLCRRSPSRRRKSATIGFGMARYEISATHSAGAPRRVVEGSNLRNATPPGGGAAENVARPMENGGVRAESARNLPTE